MTDTNTTIDPPTMAEVMNRHQPQYIAGLYDFPTVEAFTLHIGARVFNYLAETAAPIIKHYRGDLYHDALSLNCLLAEWDRSAPLEFSWSVNECGTWFNMGGLSNHNLKFNCVLFIEHNVIKFTITRIKDT